MMVFRYLRDAETDIGTVVNIEHIVMIGAINENKGSIVYLVGDCKITLSNSSVTNTMEQLGMRLDPNA